MLLARIGLALASLLLCLAAAELGLRSMERLELIPALGSAVFPPSLYTGRFRPSPNPILQFELDPAGPHVNADGFRGRDYTVARSSDPDGFRIAVLGDSVTFGRGLPLEASYPHALESLLNGPPDEARHEVLNFGVGGYNTRQEVELYRTKARKYGPDLVVLGFVLNDCFPAGAHLRARPPNSPELKALARRAAELRDPAEPAPTPAFSPPEYSRLLALVRDRLAQLRGRGDGGSALAISLMCDRAENWQLVRDAFAELADVTARDGTPVLVVIFPMLVDFVAYPLIELHWRVAKEARAHGFHTLDLLEDFEPHGAANLQHRPGDTTHPNATGNELAARRIHAFLIEQGLLEAAGRRDG